MVPHKHSYLLMPPSLNLVEESFPARFVVHLGRWWHPVCATPYHLLIPRDRRGQSIQESFLSNFYKQPELLVQHEYTYAACLKKWLGCHISRAQDDSAQSHLQEVIISPHTQWTQWGSSLLPLGLNRAAWEDSRELHLQGNIGSPYAQEGSPAGITVPACAVPRCLLKLPSLRWMAGESSSAGKYKIKTKTTHS